MQVEVQAPFKLEKPLAVVSFPTVGLAGVIAAQFLVEQLQLPLIGQVRTHQVPPAVLVRNGAVEPPIAIYGKAVACGPDAQCRSLLVVTSVAPLEREAFWNVASALAEFFREHGVDLAIVFESIAVEEGEEPTEVFTLSNGPVAGAIAKKTKRPPLKEGLIGGVSSALLLEGARADLPVLVLLTEAHEGHPDSRGGAYLAKVLDENFVKMNLDLDPLVEEAARIEGDLRRSQRRAQKAEKLARDSLATMYR